jgi:3,4-dihydroxy 2-butanone 4-phosphate synthase/GTP cyclohydrolase II
VPIQMPENKDNTNYLHTKLAKLGHLLSFDDIEQNEDSKV